MKSIDLFCSSPASTAICSSMDQSAIVRHRMRPVDRHIHRLGDTPKNRTNAAPCSSHLPFDPSRRSYHKSRKNNNTSAKQVLRRKSSADVDDLASPQSSSRYLLGDQPFLDVIPDSERARVSTDIHKYKHLDLDGFPGFRSFSTRSYIDEYPVYIPSPESARALRNPSGELSHDHLNPRKSSSAPLSNRQVFSQVVELRVSIHCKGCEGKLRKHISRMEGVTSFSIDLATKKVTVIGDVTPLEVLTSISKVKNAQFWPSPTSSSSSTSSPRVSLTR